MHTKTGQIAVSYLSYLFCPISYKMHEPFPKTVNNSSSFYDAANRKRLCLIQF